MRTLIIYHSVFGNTKQVARAIAHALEGAGPVQILPLAEAHDLDLSKADLVLIGSPTHGHGLPAEVERFLDGMPRKSLEGLHAAAFDTRNHQSKWLTGSAAVKIEQALKRAGCRLVMPPESFFVTEREGPLEDTELERASRWAHHVLESAGAGSPVGV